MLKKSLILVIAMITIVAAGKIPSFSLGSIGSPGISNPLGGSWWNPVGSCSRTGVWRNNCNICSCEFSRDVCTTIDCNNLPQNVKNSNAGADSALPQWPGSSNLAMIGQVYRIKCGYCVVARPASSTCYSHCSWSLNWP